MSDDGKDRKNPWGKPPANNGQGGSRGDAPDMDEMIRKINEGFGHFMPGGKKTGRAGQTPPEARVIGIGVLALILLWLASGFFIVNPGEHAVIQRFGAWERTKTNEGLGYHLPTPIERVTKVNVNALRRMNIGFFERRGRGGSNVQRQDIPEESQMLTADRNIVDLNLVLQWDIKSAEDFLFNIENQENTIKKVAESAIRESVGQTPMFPVISTGRDLVVQKAREIIQKNLDEYHSGVNIRQVLIQKAEVHPDVQPAFQDVQSAKQDAEDTQNRAQAYRKDILPKARGKAIQHIQEAKGYKESTVAKATGDAQRFNDIYQAYLSGKDVTKERIYIETMEDVLANAQKIILSTNGKNGGVVPYLPLNELKQKSPANNTKTEKAQ